METQTHKGKKLTGTVVSDKMDKTVNVLVERSVKDKCFGKYVRRRKKYFAHDEENKCEIGDVVEIWETRPLSKKKCWDVAKILKKGEKE